MAKIAGYTNQFVQGKVQGFDHFGVPHSDWRLTRMGGPVVGATGMGGGSSLQNLTDRYAVPPTAINLQNVVARAPAGWATNPLSGNRPVMYAGNYSNGGQAA